MAIALLVLLPSCHLTGRAAVARHSVPAPSTHVHVARSPDHQLLLGNRPARGMQRGLLQGGVPAGMLLSASPS
jgi:hypothetical protein